MSFLFQLTSAATAFFAATLAHGSYRTPVDSFYNQYQMSSDIVYGEVVAFEKTKDSLLIFNEFSDEENYRATFKIKKSWKGRRDGEIYFFYNAEKNSYWFWTSSRLKKAAKHIFPVSVGQKFLLFLREDGGKKIAQTFFGAIPVQDETILTNLPEVQALEALRAGKPMKEALGLIGSKEVKEYESLLKHK